MRESKPLRRDRVVTWVEARGKVPVSSIEGERSMNIPRHSSVKAAAWKPPVSSDAVKARTGRGWEEWLRILDKEKGPTLGHTAMAELLHGKYSVPGWWSQMVTVGYEQARGLRVKHEKKGGFEISASRTIDADARSIFRAWTDARVRHHWLPKSAITIHKATPPKSLRVTWIDGAKSIGVNFYPKTAGKTVVALQHGKLESAAQAKKMKAFWAVRLDALKKKVETR
jgi:uncharacterized protein YndB with AHSA1/START domain